MDVQKMKHRIVIETMGDGSERITVQRIEQEPTLLQRIFKSDLWETLVFNDARRCVCEKIGMQPEPWRIYGEYDILFPSVEIAKKFIDECVRRRNARTVVSTRYEEYPQ